MQYWFKCPPNALQWFFTLIFTVHFLNCDSSQYMACCCSVSIICMLQQCTHHPMLKKVNLWHFCCYNSIQGETLYCDLIKHIFVTVSSQFLFLRFFFPQYIVIIHSKWLVTVMLHDTKLVTVILYSSLFVTVQHKMLNSNLQQVC